MEIRDFEPFKSLMNDIAEYYAVERKSGGVLDMYFDDLKGYSLEAVMHAINLHRKASNGQFFPKVADIVKQLGHKNASDLDWEDILVLAHAKDTPIGVLAHLHIGSFNLKNRSDINNKVEAKSFIRKLPEIHAKFNDGELNTNELVTMAKYGVDPRLSFGNGFTAAENQTELSNRCQEVKLTYEFRAMLADKQSERLRLAPIDNDVVKKNKARLSGLLAELSADIPQNKELTAEDAKNITGIE